MSEERFEGRWFCVSPLLLLILLEVRTNESVRRLRDRQMIKPGSAVDGREGKGEIFRQGRSHFGRQSSRRGSTPPKDESKFEESSVVLHSLTKANHIHAKFIDQIETQFLRFVGFLQLKFQE